MKEFRGLHIYSKEEVDLLTKEAKESIEILPGLYILSRTTLSALVKAADVESRGSYDYAIPESWARQHGYPKGLDKVIWFYPHSGKSRIFGTPLTVREMLSWIANDYIKEENYV